MKVNKNKPLCRKIIQRCRKNIQRPILEFDDRFDHDDGCFDLHKKNRCLCHYLIPAPASMGMDNKAKIVRFNIGGTRYEVVRSILESHPGTMLNCMASEEWHDDPEAAEIFIERDGDHFKYCLSYLRDDKVLLPITARLKI